MAAAELSLRPRAPLYQRSRNRVTARVTRKLRLLGPPGMLAVKDGGRIGGVWKEGPGDAAISPVSTFSEASGSWNIPTPASGCHQRFSFLSTWVS